MSQNTPIFKLDKYDKLCETECTLLCSKMPGENHQCQTNTFLGPSPSRPQQRHKQKKKNICAKYFNHNRGINKTKKYLCQVNRTAFVWTKFPHHSQKCQMRLHNLYYDKKWIEVIVFHNVYRNLLLIWNTLSGFSIQLGWRSYRIKHCGGRFLAENL